MDRLYMYIIMFYKCAMRAMRPSNGEHWTDSCVH